MNNKRLLLSFVLGVLLFALAVPGHAASSNARLRVGHFVKDAGAIDLFVGDKSFVTNIGPGIVTEYMTLGAGTYSLAVPPTGKTTQDTLISPYSFQAQAGHDYSITLIGQAADKDVKLLVIDQTEVFKGKDVLGGSPNIWVNNLKGAPAMDVLLGGKPIITNIAYGSYGAAVFPAANYTSLTVNVSGDPKMVILPPITPWGTASIFYEPSAEYLNAFGGTFPGDPDKDYLGSLFNGEDSPLPILDFLTAFKGRGLSFNKTEKFPFTPQVFEFNTLLTLLDKAGLTAELTGAGPYVLFAPTDEAFAALPADTLKNLQSNPQLLKSVVSYHVVKGTLSRADLATAKTLITFQGSSLAVAPGANESFTINGSQAGCGCNYELANGQVFVIDHVLMPDQASVMTAATSQAK